MRLFQITHGMDPDVPASWEVWASGQTAAGVSDDRHSAEIKKTTRRAE